MATKSATTDTTTTTTRSSQSAAAKAVLDKLHILRDEIPGFEMPPTGGRKRIHTTANIPSEFVEATAVAIDRDSPLQKSSELTSDEMRESIAFSAAFEAIADELEAFAKGVRFTIANRRAKVGSNALTLYEIAKRLAKQPDKKDLLPYVEDMKRALGKRGASRKTAPAAKQA
jgi:hypothetical protein